MAHPDGESGGRATAAGTARSERRLVGHALACWEESRGERRFPGRAYLDDAVRAGFGANIFVIAVGDGEDGDEVVDCGPTLRRALGLEPVGRKAIEILPSATERGLSFCRTAIELKKPIADVGHFTNLKGEEVRYRSVLLPLSDDQETVNYLIGAFSYTLVN